MKFTEEEMATARRLRDAGLDWVPTAGHFVFDETGFCKQPSPFQDSVYFILNYEYFMKTVGGVERFQEIMTWLPTWFDCREILAVLNVSSSDITHRLEETSAIEEGNERFCL